MFWLGFGVTAVSGIAYALASMFEQHSRTESQQALHRLEKEGQARQRELEDYQRQCQEPIRSASMLLCTLLSHRQHRCVRHSVKNKNGYCLYSMGA